MAERLSDQDIQVELATLSGWKQSEDGLSIGRSFQFPDFVAAFAFMTKVALHAQSQDHHPGWSNVYNTVDIRLSTHDAGGLTEKDFALAAAIVSVL